MILISIIKKTFFLGNVTNTESEIISHFSSRQDKTIASKILKVLQREKILAKSENGSIHPKTFHRKRMIEIIRKN